MESEVECTKRLSQWQKMSGTESQEGTIPGKATFYSQFVFLLCSSFLKMEKPCVSLSVGGSLVSLVVLGDSSLKTVICIVQISGFESLITFNYIISYYINLHHITVIPSHGFSWFIWHPPTPPTFLHGRPWNSCWSSCKLPPRPKIPSCCWSSRAARTRPEPPSTAPVRCGVCCAPRGSRCHGWSSRRWMWISKPPGLDSVTKTIQQPWYCWEKSCTTKRMVETL